jgi:hypothetical protein
MTALEALKARYDAGEPLTDLETLVLTYGGETEAVELARMVWVLKRLEYIEEHQSEEMLCPICRGEKPTHYEDCELAQALDSENRGG